MMAVAHMAAQEPLKRLEAACTTLNLSTVKTRVHELGETPGGLATAQTLAELKPK